MLVSLLLADGSGPCIRQPHPSPRFLRIYLGRTRPRFNRVDPVCPSRRGFTRAVSMAFPANARNLLSARGFCPKPVQAPCRAALQPLDISGLAALVKRRLPLRETPLGDGAAHSGHDLLIIMQVMPCQQHRADDLLTAEHMMQIGPAIAPAGRTGALIVQRARIVLMARVLDVQHPVPREHLPRPPRP